MLTMSGRGTPAGNTRRAGNRSDCATPVSTPPVRLVTDSSAKAAPLWATLTATLLGVGQIRPGPGTWGSAVTVLFWWLLTRWSPPEFYTWLAIGLAILAVAAGIPAATQVARAASLKDPQFVVIDEFAGQLISFVAIPISWKSLLVGFILFRGFDTLKPPPARQLESLPEGSGIVLDDVAAGLYVLAIMHALLHFGLLPR